MYDLLDQYHPCSFTHLIYTLLILKQMLERNLTYINLLIRNVLHLMFVFRYVGRPKHQSQLDILCNISYYVGFF
jgi:hypothetical protein